MAHIQGLTFYHEPCLNQPFVSCITGQFHFLLETQAKIERSVCKHVLV